MLLYTMLFFIINFEVLFQYWKNMYKTSTFFPRQYPCLVNSYANNWYDTQRDLFCFSMLQM